MSWNAWKHMDMETGKQGWLRIKVQRDGISIFYTVFEKHCVTNHVNNNPVMRFD
jgi:hypothetical protein